LVRGWLRTQAKSLLTKAGSSLLSSAHSVIANGLPEKRR